ncbi:hypothetical protein BLOT_002595 [Blomia tropicalis]|nr:hypothetical protein BLOT_002595 [Blomia tropicalis]
MIDLNILSILNRKRGPPKRRVSGSRRDRSRSYIFDKRYWFNHRRTNQLWVGNNIAWRCCLPKPKSKAAVDRLDSTSLKTACAIKRPNKIYDHNRMTRNTASVLTSNNVFVHR